MKFWRRFLTCIILVFSCNSMAALLFSDGFEYVVDPANSSTCSRFVSSGGWDGYKSINCTGSHRGNLYTVTTIPGYSGSFPGTNSSRALLVELLPYSTSGGLPDAQTDVYLQFGGPTEPTDYIPANSWFQYWIYVNRSGSQMSQFSEGKWLYPSRTGNYPADTNTGSHWLMVFSINSKPTFWENGQPGEHFPQLNCYNNCDITSEADWNQWKLGHNRTSRGGVLVPNVWQLVKIHFDTSGSDPRSPGNSVYEMWIREVNGQWRKASEWIGGLTPNFIWSSPGTTGHRALRIPTTIGYYDSWIYLDDFVIATSEADLPTYDEPQVQLLSAPTNFRVQ